MKIKIGSLWINKKDFKLEVVKKQCAGWYEYKHINGRFGGYISAAALANSFKEISSDAPA